MGGEQGGERGGREEGGEGEWQQAGPVLLRLNDPRQQASERGEDAGMKVGLRADRGVRAANRKGSRGTPLQVRMEDVGWCGVVWFRAVWSAGWWTLAISVMMSASMISLLTADELHDDSD